MYKKIGIISREEKQFKQNYKVFNDEIVKVINKYNCLAVGIIVILNKTQMWNLIK